MRRNSTVLLIKQERGPCSLNGLSFFSATLRDARFFPLPPSRTLLETDGNYREPLIRSHGGAISSVHTRSPDQEVTTSPVRFWGLSYISKGVGPRFFFSLFKWVEIHLFLHLKCLGRQIFSYRAHSVRWGPFFCATSVLERRGRLEAHFPWELQFFPSIRAWDLGFIKHFSKRCVGMSPQKERPWLLYEGMVCVCWSST